MPDILPLQLLLLYQIPPTGTLTRQVKYGLPQLLMLLLEINGLGQMPQSLPEIADLLHLLTLLLSKELLLDMVIGRKKRNPLSLHIEYHYGIKTSSITTVIARVV